jgi:hypothetical protein
MNTQLANDVDDRARLEELLCDRAVFGLDPSEAAELRALQTRLGVGDDLGFDLASASVAAATLPSDEPLPAALRQRVLATAERRATPRSSEPHRSSRSPVAWLALAASLLVAAWFGRFIAYEGSAGEPTIAQLRAAIDDLDDTTRVAWAATDDRAAATPEGADRAKFSWGEVVWNDRLQQGYMSFRGLAPNDPEVEQYQLWVFDAERDDRYPVDGGVFDVAYSADGDTAIVPIRAKLAVQKAVMFAITVERPGGVVVSDRTRLPLLAKR